MADPGFFLGGWQNLKKNGRGSVLFYTKARRVGVFLNYKRENGSMFLALKKNKKILNIFK